MSTTTAPPGASMFAGNDRDHDTSSGIPRDRYDRPMILQEDGTLKAYTRASTLAKALDEADGLIGWKARMTGKGVATNPDLIANFAALNLESNQDPEKFKAAKKRAAELVEMAMERAGTSRKRELGTALHTFTEMYDRGEPIPYLPDELKRTLQAYVLATETIDMLAIEQFLVVDGLATAGTADRIGRSEALWGTTKPRVLDVKTGSADYSILGWACQLEIYRRGQRYNPLTGERLPFPEDLDDEWGTIIHLDPITERCRLYNIPLKIGADALRLANGIRAVRREAKRKVSPMAASTISRIFEANELDELNVIFHDTKPWNDREKKAAERRATEIRQQKESQK